MWLWQQGACSLSVRVGIMMFSIFCWNRNDLARLHVREVQYGLDPIATVPIVILVGIILQALGMVSLRWHMRFSDASLGANGDQVARC